MHCTLVAEQGQIPEIVGSQQMFVAFSSLLPLPSSLLKVMQMKSFCLIFRKYLLGACLWLNTQLPYQDSFIGFVKNHLCLEMG